MPTYKYTLKNGQTRYYTKFYYLDWEGTKQVKCKRGFIRKKEAKEYEVNFLAKLSNTPSVPFDQLLDEYINKCKNKNLKKTTIANKEYLIKKHILPYFLKKPINEISTFMISQWQKLLCSSDAICKYSPTYIYNINNLLKYIFDYAVKVYGLHINPVTACGTIGKARNYHIDYWTIEEFTSFIIALKDTKRNRSAQIKRKTDEYTLSVAFIILFFCGLRVGELLALTRNDIDLKNSKIKISKTYKRFQGEDLISPPKTLKSRRTISIPAIVKNALTDYLNKAPIQNKNDRIFQTISYNSLQRAIHSEAKLIGLKNIRVHDLRHSCISMLANAGCDITQIREYMGHSKISMTLDTYTHLYPNRFDEITSKIDEIAESLTFDAAKDKTGV